MFMISMFDTMILVAMVTVRQHKDFHPLGVAMGELFLHMHLKAPLTPDQRFFLLVGWQEAR